MTSVGVTTRNTVTLCQRRAAAVNMIRGRSNEEAAPTVEGPSRRQGQQQQQQQEEGTEQRAVMFLFRQAGSVGGSCRGAFYPFKIPHNAMSSSSSRQDEAGRLRSLLKLFMKYVHPDFFMHAHLQSTLF